MEIENFNHSITFKVRFREVDLMGVVNNAVYFSYFEDARIDYLNTLKSKFTLNEFLEGNNFVIMAHNECDYIKPLVMNDTVTVYTKINYIKKSSFGFLHLVTNQKNEIIAKGGGVFVYIDKGTMKSKPLPQEFYDVVKSFEKEVNIIE